MKRLALFSAAGLAVSLLFTGCSTSAATSPTASQPSPKTVRLLAYDSFALPKGIWDDFTAQTGLTVEVLTDDDTGKMLNKAILTKEAPIADVMWGIDRTFLSRALTAKLFAPHGLADVPVDPAARAKVGADRVIPVDTAEVCINADTDALKSKGLLTPANLDDLTKPELRGQLVVENPATSAPGLAFLLATIERYGENGWQAYWKKLDDNKTMVVNGWTEAWETEFSGTGKGKHALVVSYSTSPVAVVAFSTDPKATTSSVISLPDTCFATGEYAGVLAGSGNETNASKLLAYLLSEKVQSELAMNMYVFPTRIGVQLPEPYTRLGVTPSPKQTNSANKVTLTPERIQAMRDQWIDEWTKIVLG
jgi:thiamine transport system substrate-binding protein